MKTKLTEVFLFAQALCASTLIGQSPLLSIQGSMATPASQSCGVRSLYEVARLLKPDDPDAATLLSVHTTGIFVSMAELDELSTALHLGLVPVKRVAGDKLPVPSVAHWGREHFVAILENSRESYRVFDPALDSARWLTADQINAQISGQFLAPATQLLEKNWHRLASAEAEQIVGSVVIG